MLMGACVAPITENKVSVFAQQLVLRQSGRSPQRRRPEQRRGPESAGVGCVLQKPTRAPPPPSRTVSTGFHVINHRLNHALSLLCPAPSLSCHSARKTEGWDFSCVVPPAGSQAPLGSPEGQGEVHGCEPLKRGSEESLGPDEPQATSPALESWTGALSSHATPGGFCLASAAGSPSPRGPQGGCRGHPLF